MISNGFILEPYYELLPDYKLYPFTTTDLTKNRNLPESTLCDYYFTKRFENQRFYYCKNGRHAISISLDYYKLKPTDCVTIFTTTGNHYISSCVTSEIEKFCNWSRSIQDNTKVLFVIHEFGYPFQNLMALKKYNIPIIEDCAYSFLSTDKENLIGKLSDFIIYSFPKLFPIQMGGLLVSKHDLNLKMSIDPPLLRYLKNTISAQIPNLELIKTKRLENYCIIRHLLSDIGFNQRFELDKDSLPGVYMFKSEMGIELPELKKYMYLHGIQCSVFYGESSFFIPNHQNLNEADFLYFREVIRSFINKYTK